MYAPASVKSPVNLSSHIQKLCHCVTWDTGQDGFCHFRYPLLLLSYLSVQLSDKFSFNLLFDAIKREFCIMIHSWALLATDSAGEVKVWVGSWYCSFTTDSGSKLCHQCKMPVLMSRIFWLPFCTVGGSRDLYMWSAAIAGVPLLTCLVFTGQSYQIVAQ